MWKKVKVCRSASTPGVAPGAVPTVVRPLPLARFTVDVTHPVGTLGFTQYQRVGFYQRLVEGGSLPRELIDGIRVVLGEETGNNIPLGRKGKHVEPRPSMFIITEPPGIDIGKATAFSRLQGKVFKSQRFFIIQFLLRERILLVAIVHGLIDIGTLGSQRDIKRFGSGTHRKQVAAGGSIGDRKSTRLNSSHVK